MLARFLHAEELGHRVAQCLGAFVFAAKRDCGHRVAQHPGTDRVTLGVVGVQQALRRCPLDHLGQLPSQIHRILHTGLKALSTVGRMYVRGVPGHQHPSLAVGFGLPGGIGKPGDPGGTVYPVIGSVDGDERLAEIGQGGLAGGSDLPLGHQNPHRSPIRVDHLAVANFVFHPAQGMNAEGVTVDAPFRRRLGQFGLGDQVAGCRIRSRERDAGGLADQTASAVAPDEILRPQRPAVTDRDVDAGVVLCEARHLNAAIDRHRQFPDPPGEDALDMVLPQPEPVVVPGGKVADVQTDRGEARDLGHLSLRQEPIGNSALIEDLDGA